MIEVRPDRHRGVVSPGRRNANESGGSTTRADRCAACGESAIRSTNRSSCGSTIRANDGTSCGSTAIGSPHRRATKDIAARSATSGLNGSASVGSFHATGTDFSAIRTFGASSIIRVAARAGKAASTGRSTARTGIRTMVDVAAEVSIAQPVHSSVGRKSQEVTQLAATRGTAGKSIAKSITRKIASQGTACGATEASTAEIATEIIQPATCTKITTQVVESASSTKTSTT